MDMEKDLVSRDQFERLVTSAIDKLPGNIQEKIENVEFVVEDGDSPGGRLLGLYYGIPKTRRGSGYSLVLPDKITFYKRTIERYAQRRENLEFIVYRVVWHEIAHHLGFSEVEVARLEQKWRKQGRV